MRDRKGQHKPEIGFKQYGEAGPEERQRECGEGKELQLKSKKLKLFVNGVTHSSVLDWLMGFKEDMMGFLTSLSLSLLMATSFRDLFPGALLPFFCFFLKKYKKYYININNVLLWDSRPRKIN